MQNEKQKHEGTHKRHFQHPSKRDQLDGAVQATTAHHKEELITQVYSLKKENKGLVSNVESVQSELGHVLESFLNLTMLHK